MANWHEEEDNDGETREVRPFPSLRVSQLGLLVSAIASLLMFVSALWQHIASAVGASMVRSLSYKTIKAVVGPAAMVLGWGSVFVESFATILFWLEILSIRALAETFDG
ncbi:hypothetical protein NHQ30_010776 [Ciborinia camelliae]|nr:hypothetical protein NHQ30_010776 [Ciborinia camelliae]